MTPTTRAGFAAAVAMKRLAHPGIVRVLDVATDGDDVWVAMEVADGGSLAERLAHGGALPVQDAVHIATCVCRALSYAHAHGVLHLDVKPANVLFADDGRVLLADFGADTRGTAGFAAPEVERGEATVDERADVYGVGALLAAMLGPGPSPLAPVVTRAMAADPADRYASVDELAAALRDPAGPAGPVGPVGPVVPDMPADSGTRPFGPRPPRPAVLVVRRRRWPRVGAATAGALLVLLGALALAGHGSAGERREHGACQYPASPRRTTLDNGAGEVADEAAGARTAGEAAGARVAGARAADDVAGEAAGARAADEAAAAAGARAAGDVLHADVDGDGCDDRLVRTGNVLAWNGLRFSVGSPGDVVLVGDWDCDGVATAAAWRPADGVAFVFDGWAGAGEELPAARRVSLRPGGGPPAPCRG